MFDGLPVIHSGAVEIAGGYTLNEKNEIELPDMAPGADDVVDRWIFSGNRGAVREVHVAGERLVADGAHRDRATVAARYATAMRGLLAG